MENEAPEPSEKTWISLGNRQFYVEDVQSIFIQANHLIVNFDYTDKQIVIYFGLGPKGAKNAKAVFDALGEMYNAHVMPIPEDADLSPNLMKTAYGEEINRSIQSAIRYEKEKLKLRFQKKVKSLTAEFEALKKAISKTID